MRLLHSPFARSLFSMLLPGVLALSCASARAANFTVTSTADNGSGGCTAAGSGDGCTLREAIVAANANLDADTIGFSASGVISLTSSLPILIRDVVISGPTAGVTVSGAGNYAVISVSGGNVTLQNFSVSNGRGSAASTAGGINVSGGVVKISGMTLENNLGSAASTTLAATGPGALSVNGGAVTVINSTFSGNTGAAAVAKTSQHIGRRGGAGAVQITSGTLTLVHCTLSGNSGGRYATDIGSTGFPTGTNTPGGNGGVAVLGGTSTLGNSIVAQNIAGKFGSANISGSYTALGTNLIDIDPQLGALGNNGGPTKTFLPNAGSSAIDGGSNATASQFNVASDQRGVTRPFGTAVDIGAVEISDEVPGQTFIAHSQSVSTPEDAAKDITLAATDKTGGNNPISYSIVAAPTHGDLSGTAPNVTYMPDADFNGADAFTFKAQNSTSSDTATVTITVTPVNDAPVAINGALATSHNTIAVIDLATLASDVETGDANLTYEIVAAPPINAGTLAGSGSTRSFTPNQNFAGQTSFTFRARDNGDPDGTPGNALFSATKTVTVTVRAALVVITSPVDDEQVETLSAVSGTVTDNGSSGISGVALFLQRQSDGKYWNGTTWTSTQSGIAATVNANAWTVGAGSLPPANQLAPGFYILRAVATYQDGNMENSSNVTIQVPSQVALLSLTLNPQSVTGGASTTATVTLDGSSQFDTFVDLSSSNSTVATTPQSVTILAGQTSANFTVSTPERNAGASATITASFDNVVKSAQLAVSATPYTPRPDVLIKLGAEADAAYALNDVYQSTPSGGQVKTQNIAFNTKATYLVRIQNDGAQSQRFVVKAVETTESGWTTAYKIAGTDVTSTLKSAAGRTTALLAPGAFEIVTVEATPTLESAKGTAKSITISAFKNAGDVVAFDAVRAVTSTPAIAFDLKIQSGANGAFVGNGIINTTASGQTVSDTAARGATKTYFITFANNKGSNDQFKLKANGGNSGWTVRYYENASGLDITSAVIADNWLSPQIPNDGTYVIKCTISPGFSLLVGSSFSVLATATSAYNAVIKDAVKATVKVVQ